MSEQLTAGEVDKKEQPQRNVLTYTTTGKEQLNASTFNRETVFLSKALVFNLSLIHI